MSLARQIARKVGGNRRAAPEEFSFDRPLVLFQSDDWGRVGVRDRAGWEDLQAAGLELGERPYDSYSLETAEDVSALHGLLKKHQDSAGRAPCVVMNFCAANLDFEKIQESNFQALLLQPLAQGLPGKWRRPRLFDAYRRGMADGVFYPALHGTTHFCRRAMERHMVGHSERGALVRTLWRAHTPYIHWRMPWVGFEYWEREGDPQFLSADVQGELVREAVGFFSDFFGTRPQSACAPGYRANDDTRRAWARCGIRVAQNGPAMRAPHFDDSGLLHTYRAVEFEPALDPARYTVERCMEQAQQCFARGIPAVVSVHSINFQSTLKDFRSETLRRLDEFLSALERKYPDLVYLHDLDLHALVTAGMREPASGQTTRIRLGKGEASLVGASR